MTAKTKKKMKTLEAILNTLLTRAHLTPTSAARRKTARYLLKFSPLGEAITKFSRENAREAYLLLDDPDAPRIVPSDDNNISIMLVARLKQLGVKSTIELRTLILGQIFDICKLEEWCKTNAERLNDELWKITEIKPRKKTKKDEPTESNTDSDAEDSNTNYAPVDSGTAAIKAQPSGTQGEQEKG
jgi:hypothetical protein